MAFGQLLKAKDQRQVFRLGFRKNAELKPIIQRQVLHLLEVTHKKLLMFQYKDCAFYNSYFKNLDGFKLIEEFQQPKEEKNLYVGLIEAIDTIHPLILRVEIPMSFPHMRLLFRTKSLRGYPHLINDWNDAGDWFCLNTPFAETPEEQLDQEVTRLKEWITRQMHKDLPAIIDDPKSMMALAIANAYEWENPDEVHEFSSKALLTFVGDFHYSEKFLNKEKGYINCIKTADSRFYALQNISLTDFRLPYVIVDEYPECKESFDFLKLRAQYDWGHDICEHLLPMVDADQEWIYSGRGVNFKEYSEEEALSLLQEPEAELNKDVSYLNASNLKTLNNSAKRTLVPMAAKELLKKEINDLKAEIIKNHKYKFSFGNMDFNNMSDDEIDYQNYIEDEYEKEMYQFRYFALGVKIAKSISWSIFYTNKNARESERYTFDLKLVSAHLDKTISYPLNMSYTQQVSEEMYFGRGAFSAKLSNKKIALVGLGAIGSMVAESMARSGVSKLGLWDNDVVEPGNICRSAYSLNDLGESKVEAIARIVKAINPNIKSENVFKSGRWRNINLNRAKYINGSFYGNVEYGNQKDAVKQIEDYDLIIDCTGSNEMLHFLSYAVPNIPVISLCITNKANELLCVSNQDGNPFELRKAYLSRIEQDTKNYFIEGSGCYSPTFLATNSDIASLVNLVLKDLNKSYSEGELMHSTVYSYNDRGILADKLVTYELEGYDIIMNIPKETLLDAEYMSDVPSGSIGYVLGAYSRDGMQIMVTHIIPAEQAEVLLNDVYSSSKGIIDYIGDYEYSGPNYGTYRESSYEAMRQKATDTTINTNNPLLAIRNPDGSLLFYLYINDELVPFSLRD